MSAARSCSSPRALSVRRTIASESATCCDPGHRVVFIVEESFAGRLEAQGFEERLMRLGRRPRCQRSRPVLDRLHPRHGSRLPQADDRAARASSCADLAGPHRRGEVRRAAPARDHRRGRAGRDRGGQRGLVPGARRARQAVGPDRLAAIQPSSRTRRPAVLVAATRARIAGERRRSWRRSNGRTRTCGRTTTRSADPAARRASPGP